MNTFKRIFSIILCVGLLVTAMMGCGLGNNDSQSDSTVKNSISTADVNFIKDGEAVYRVVRADGDEGSSAVAHIVFKKLKEKLKVNSRNCADTEDGTDRYEILIGLTNREESKVAAAYLEEKTGGHYNDYVICTIGKKICIYSKSPDTLKVAAEYFVENFVKPEGVKGGIDYSKVAEGNFETITVNGVNIGKFQFVRPHYNSSWLTEVEMEKIVESVYQKTGYMLNINHDTNTVPEEYEIVVGNTSRDGVEKITNYDEFKITVKGKKIYLNGGSAHATAMAVSEFAKILKGDVKDSVSYTGSYEAAMNSYDKSTTFHKTWGDDFDGNKLDTTKWKQLDEKSTNNGQNDKTSVRSSKPSDVFVADGKFHICARQDENYYYGGMIRTTDIMEYKYGYAEISQVMPHGDSFWTAWWTGTDDLMSSMDEKEPAFLHCEIDIVECFGNSKSYAANCHRWPTGGGTAKYEHTALDDKYGNDRKYSCPDEGAVLGDGFHTYGFLWDDTQMSFTCDGNLFFTYNYNTIEDLEAFNHSMYFIYSMAVGFENAPGNPITQNPDEWENSNKLILDWINLYQKDDGKHTLNWKYAE